MKKILGSSLILVASSQALAHPGHDHQHWLADPIHALTALAVGAITLFAAYQLSRKLKANKQQSK